MRATLLLHVFLKLDVCPRCFTNFVQSHELEFYHSLGRPLELLQCLPDLDALDVMAGAEPSHDTVRSQIFGRLRNLVFFGNFQNNFRPKN